MIKRMFGRLVDSLINGIFQKLVGLWAETVIEFYSVGQQPAVHVIWLFPPAFGRIALFGCAFFRIEPR